MPTERLESMGLPAWTRRLVAQLAAGLCWTVAAVPGVALADEVLEPPTAAAPARAKVAAPARSTPGRTVHEQTNVHGLGIAGSFATGTGLTYRRYFGDTALQVAALGIVTNRGDDAVAFVGASVAQYLLVWSTSTPSGVMPSTTALRVVGGGQWYERRWTETTFTSGSTTQTSRERQRDLSLGAGIGFEFGGIVRPGFSLSVDLLLTGTWRNGHLESILPLPQSALVYSW